MPNNPSTFALHLNDVKKRETSVLLSKHRDYGPKNIANAPGGPMMGLAVRLHDKMARLVHLLEQDAEPEHESLMDTMLDIANYGTIGQMVLEGVWPGTSQNPPTSETVNPPSLDARTIYEQEVAHIASVVASQNTRPSFPGFNDGGDA
jgi:hypothetical protein